MPSLPQHLARRPQSLVVRVTLLLLSVLATVLPVRPAGATGTSKRSSAANAATSAPARYPTVTITGNSTASTYTNSTGSTSLTVTNTSSTEQVTVLMSVTTCSGNITNCTVSPAGGNLMPGASMPLTVGFKGGPTPSTGSTIQITVKNGADNNTLASKQITVTVLAQPNAPVVSTSPHRGDAIDVSQCVADCFEMTLAESSPAYISVDQPRSVTVLYRSGRANPYGRLQLGALEPTPNSPVTSFRLQLADPNGVNVTFTNGATSLFFARKTTDTTRLAAQFDASAIPTSARLYTATVTSFAGATQLGTTYTPVRIVIINDRASPLGAGVDFAGFQRLFTNQTGGVLVTDGSGSASFFSGTCVPGAACTFTSPKGDFSQLATGGGQYKRTYPDGSVVTFDVNGRQLSTKTRFGDSTYVTWGTTSTGIVVPTGLTDVTGAFTLLWFRGPNDTYGVWKEGSLGGIRTPTMAAFSLAVDASNNLVTWADVDGNSKWRVTYDAQHRITQVIDKSNVGWNYGYWYGATLDSTIAPSVKLADNSVVRPLVQLREMYSGLYLAAAQGHGKTTSDIIPVPTFDIRAAINDPLGYGTYFTLSRFGSPTVVYAPLTNPAYATYDTLTGQLTRSVSPTGAVQRLSWVNDQLRQTIDSSGGTAKTVNIEYETSYSLPLHIYGNVAEQWFTYDHTKSGWPLKTSKVGVSTALPTTYAFDTYGRPTSVIDPIGHTTTYAYEATGLRNHTSVTAPNTQSTTFAHDAWGRDTLVKDPKLATWRQGYDILNRVAWTLSPLVGDTTKFQYDSLDNITKVTDAKGQAYTTVRNALGWVVKQTDPAGHADSAAYDSAGRVVYTKSRQQRVVTFQYDALGRVTQQTGAGGSDVVTFTYDPNHRWVAARSVTGGTLVTTDTIFTDSVGRTTAEVSYRPGAYSWSVRTGYQADKPGRVSLNVLKSGAINGGPTNTVSWTNFWYDSAQRLSQIRLLQGNSVFTYNDDDQPQAVTFPSGLGEGRSYTSSHALSKRFYTLTAIDTVLGRWYRSDSLARLVRRGGAPGKKLQDFGYDLKGRLSTWQKKTDTGVPSCQNIDGYGYDCSSTQLHVDSTVTPLYDNVGNPADPGVVVDTANRLRTFSNYTMTYDADGNMLTRTVSGVTDTYTWNDFGQLTAVARNGTTLATFAYDGFGRRIRKTAGGSTTDYVWDGDQLIADGGATGGAMETYSYYPGSDQLHSVTLSGQTYYASIEPGGDVNALLRGSDNAVVAQYAYTPWGEIESSTQQVTGLNSLRWKGLLWDDETKLYYMRARYYAPSIRRFISEDPIGIDGGINEYVFVDNEPINGSDPAGLDPQYLPGVHVVAAAPGSPWGEVGTGGSSFWNPGFFSHRGGGAPPAAKTNDLKSKACAVLPSGSMSGISLGVGGTGGAIGGVERVVNYSTGETSAFTFRGAAVGWNGGFQASASTGLIWGNLGAGNSNYSGGFSGFAGGGVVGVNLQQSSGGLSSTKMLRSALPRSGVSVAALTYNASVTPFTAVISVTNYSNPKQLGRFSGWGATDWILYGLKNLACR